MKIKMKIKTLQRRLLDLLYKLYDKNASKSEIEKAVKTLLDKFDLKSILGAEFEGALAGIIAQAEAEALKKYKWIKKHTADPADTALGTKIVSTSQNHFARVDKMVNKGVLSVVVRGIKAGAGVDEVAASLGRVMRKTAANAFTVANTGLAAFDRVSALTYSAEAGITKKKYKGPPAQRPFCKENLERTFTLEQISYLDNGMGLDVLVYMGGWNCRHWWEDVVPADPSNITADDVQYAMNYLG